MQTIFIDKITAFASTAQPVDVYAKDGRGVYTHPNTKGLEVHFNLPPGEYVTESELTELPYPLEYICPELPFRIIYRPMKHMRFTVKENKHLCSIDFDTDPNYVDVVIDPEVAGNDIPFCEYILFHEQGHFYYGGAGKPGTKKYYKIEHYCDIFAASEMLKFGFNPSQCYYACELSLSERPGAKWRKWLLGKWIKKIVTIDKNIFGEVQENFEYMENLNSKKMEHYADTPTYVVTQKVWKANGNVTTGIMVNGVFTAFTNHAVENDILGDTLVSKEQKPGTDSFLWHFQFNSLNPGLFPNTHGYKDIYAMAEPDEISFDNVKVDPITKTSVKTSQAISSILNVFENITSILLVGLTIYIIHSFLKKDS